MSSPSMSCSVARRRRSARRYPLRRRCFNPRRQFADFALRRNPRLCSRTGVSRVPGQPRMPRGARRCGRAGWPHPARAKSLRTAQTPWGPSPLTLTAACGLQNGRLPRGRRRCFWQTVLLTPANTAEQPRGRAVFRSTPTALTQSSTTPSSASLSRGLRYIVLILAHADRLGVDLDTARQAVLQAAARWIPPSAAIRRNPEIPPRPAWTPCKPTRGFGYNHVGEIAAVFPDEIRDEDFALPGGGAVADGDAGDVVFIAQAAECFFGLFGFLVRRGGR